MIDDYKIFKAAYEKDYGPLVEFLRTGVDLLPRHRELLIKILEGKMVRPRHRQARTVRHASRHGAIVARVHELGGKQTAAIAQTMREFRCSEGTVKKALRDHRYSGKAVKLVEEAIDMAIRLHKEGHPSVLSDFLPKLEALHAMTQASLADLYRDVGLKRWLHPHIIDDGAE